MFYLPSARLSAVSIASIATVVTFGFPAQAIIPTNPGIVSFDNPTEVPCGVADCTAGYSFTLTGQYNVSFLGFWNASGNGSNGLIEPHEIGIWDDVGALVVSGTVDDATATLLDDFWWTDISNVVLAPGNYTIGALTESGSELFALGVQNLVTDPRVVYGTGLVVSGGGGLARPTNPIGLPPDAFGPNFAEHIGIPSVPGPLPLLGIGTAFGFSRKLSRRIKAVPPVASAIN